MLIDPKLNDFVKTHRSPLVGKVIEVNRYWGWLMVKFPNGIQKEYPLNNGKNQTLRKLTEEERADYLFRLEELGITDFWKES